MLKKKRGGGELHDQEFNRDLSTGGRMKFQNKNTIPKKVKYRFQELVQG